MTSNDEKAALSRGARRRARYREIAAVLWDERVLNVFKGAGLDEHAPPEAARREGDPGVKEKELPRAVRIRHALERLGPAFIKAGQILATRRDLVPPDLAEELAKLQDDVPTLPWEEIKARIEAELGHPVEELFATFDAEPIAAASIGQVYRATLPDGTLVAVKVQRPGVTETMDIDLEILIDQAHRLAVHTQWGKDFDVASLAEELASILRSELDYRHEGHALDRFREAFADDKNVLFPAVYWDHSSQYVLTMDFIDGVPATTLEGGQVAGVSGARLVEVGVGCYFRQIFEMGFYHADPHAGNLFAMPDGRVAFVDFGRTASISQRNRDAVFDMLLAVFDDDVRGATEAVLTMCGMPPHADIAQLEVELGQIMASYRRAQTNGGGLDALVQKLLTMMRAHQLHLPTELTVLLTTLGMVDGVAGQIDPDYRLVDVAKPFAKKLLPEQFGPERIIRASLRSVRAYGRLIDELPVQVTRVLRRAGEGEFRVSVRPTGFEQMMERLQAGFTLLAYALIVSALIIGSSILVSRPELTGLERAGSRLVLVGAIASVIVLLTRMARAEWRKRRADKRAGD